MAAWRTSGTTPWRASSAVASSKRAICSAVSSVVGASAHARCVISPRTRTSGISASFAASSGSASIVTPRRAIPVSTFRCTSTGPGRVARANQARECLDLPEIVHHRNEVARDDLVVRVAVVPAHDEDRRDDAGLAQLDRLFEQRHAEAVDLRALERTRDGRSAVAVAVGLEDRPDARLAGVPARDAQVVAQRFEVDLGPRRSHGVGRGGAARTQDAGDERSGHRKSERPRGRR